MKVCLPALVLCTGVKAVARNGFVRLSDTGKPYTQKNPMREVWKDWTNWTQVPLGKTDYKPCGDFMLEGESFHLFLFSNTDDNVDLMAKIGDTGYKPNEIYKVHDTGLRNFWHGTMAMRLLKNTAEEIVVEHAGVGQRDAKPIVTTYRLSAGKPWLEVRPVERVNRPWLLGGAFTKYLCPRPKGETSGREYAGPELILIFSIGSCERNGK